jgi:hypothetical protein
MASNIAEFVVVVVCFRAAAQESSGCQPEAMASPCAVGQVVDDRPFFGNPRGVQWCDKIRHGEVIL